MKTELHGEIALELIAVGFASVNWYSFLLSSDVFVPL